MFISTENPTNESADVLFCSRSLIEFNLFTLGLKLVGSRRKVISSDARKRFMPESNDWGLK